MSTSLIKCKQEISVPSSVVSQRKENFPKETVSSLLDRLFPKTSTSGILGQLKTNFQTGVRIIPWLQPTKPSLGENPPACKSAYKGVWNSFSAQGHSSWGATANKAHALPVPARWALTVSDSDISSKKFWVGLPILKSVWNDFVKLVIQSRHCLSGILFLVLLFCQVTERGENNYLKALEWCHHWK